MRLKEPAQFTASQPFVVHQQGSHAKAGLLDRCKALGGASLAADSAGLRNGMTTSADTVSGPPSETRSDPYATEKRRSPAPVFLTPSPHDASSPIPILSLLTTPT